MALGEEHPKKVLCAPCPVLRAWRRTRSIHRSTERNRAHRSRGPRDLDPKQTGSKSRGRAMKRSVDGRWYLVDGSRKGALEVLQSRNPSGALLRAPSTIYDLPDTRSREKSRAKRRESRSRALDRFMTRARSPRPRVFADRSSGPSALFGVFSVSVDGV
jgi:hypothetical protein